MEKALIEFKNIRIEIIKEFSGRILLKENDVIQKGVLPKLIEIINGLKLDISIKNKNGNNKNTQQLGKEIINLMGNVNKFDNQFIDINENSKRNVNNLITLKQIDSHDSLIQLSSKYSWKRLFIQDLPYEFSDIKLKFNENSCVYRWIIIKDDDLMIYIGETKSFTKRINQYVKPGIDQKTNIRLNSNFKTYIKEGYKIYLEILDIKEMIINDNFLIQHKEINLDLKEFRRLIENYFIIDAKLKNIRVLNK